MTDLLRRPDQTHHIGSKIRDLRKLDRGLSELAGKCRGPTVPVCQILDALGKGE